MKKRRNLFLGAVSVLAFLIILAALTTREQKNVYPNGYIPFQEKNPSQGIKLDQEELRLDSIGLYSGIYVEDGTDDPVENVVGAMFTNRSDQMLQLAEIEICLDQEHTAVFQITNIPARKSVFVLDRNRLTGKENMEASFVSDAAVFFDEVPVSDGKLTAAGKDGWITLENKTDETYPQVYVYYKTKIGKNSYFGGITYRVPFEGVEGRMKIGSDAGHYSSKNSEILEIQILDEEEEH